MLGEKTRKQDAMNKSLHSVNTDKENMVLAHYSKSKGNDFCGYANETLMECCLMGSLSHGVQNFGHGS